MEYLLVMSFSGSTITGFYLLLKYLLKDNVSSRLYYLIIKEAVLFFLIPLPFLKSWYRKVIHITIPKVQMLPLTWTRYVVHAGERTYFNTFAVIQTTAVAVWLLIVCIMMVRLFIKYFRIRRVILKYEGAEMTEKQLTFLAGLKKQYSVRRTVILCQGWKDSHTITFGVCRPVIICDKDIDSWEAEIHIRHEMVHIKRLDALWKMLTRLAVVLHWWNPIAWKLQHDFEQACEYSCDEIIMQGKTKEEVKVYLRLLIEEACVAAKTKATSMGWQNGFADDMENMKERMSNLMKKKSWNRYAAGMLTVVLAFANSITVFAYKDTLHQEMAEDTQQEAVTETLQTDVFSFTPDGAEGEVLIKFDGSEKIKMMYDKQFVDMEGNIYPYSEEDTVTTYRSCSHHFISGTSTEHNKYTDGSCKTRVYRSQRCDICGYVIRGERINTVTYEVCPH